jgi:hypothetical protein
VSGIFSFLGPVIGSVPSVRRLMAERDRLRDEAARDRAEIERLRADCQQLQLGVRFVPPGHFYSPFPSLADVAANAAAIFDERPREIPGVDLREQSQMDLLQRLASYYAEMPFTRHKTEGLRYYFENPAYSYSDAICLYGMIRHLQPRRIVEVGSGFSSCVTLDTCERFLDPGVELTFIEPHPDLLLSLITPEDRNRIRIVPSRLQEVAPAQFDALGPNDILFIDSTHVSKVNSDVNRLVFEVLPRLAPGVSVHVHDVQYPFEYPRAWVEEGRAWNEAYLFRAFLQYNSAFEIVLMNTFMEHFHESFFRERMPLCLENPGGSLWIRRR